MEYRGRPLIHPETIAVWRDWLTRHHRDTDGVWLARWKKASGKIPLDYAQIVEEALCFGWIDGLTNTLDDGRQAQLLTPRRRGSGWSPSNKERVQRLIADGRMTKAGMRVIEAAKADGSWSMQDAAEALNRGRPAARPAAVRRGRVPTPPPRRRHAPQFLVASATGLTRSADPGPRLGPRS